jgi:hypothetical protein
MEMAAEQIGFAAFSIFFGFTIREITGNIV